MSELISGKDALIALANGKGVEMFNLGDWQEINHKSAIGLFLNDVTDFRLKPKTITLNGVEVPAPFEPKDGDAPFILCATSVHGYSQIMGYKKSIHLNYIKFGAWRTEEEIEQVVSAVRSAFKPK